MIFFHLLLTSFHFYFFLIFSFFIGRLSLKSEIRLWGINLITTILLMMDLFTWASRISWSILFICDLQSESIQLTHKFEAIFWSSQVKLCANQSFLKRTKNAVTVSRKLKINENKILELQVFSCQDNCHEKKKSMGIYRFLPMQLVLQYISLGWFGVRVLVYHQWQVLMGFLGLTWRLYNCLWTW